MSNRCRVLELCPISCKYEEKIRHIRDYAYDIDIRFRSMKISDINDLVNEVCQYLVQILNKRRNIKITELYYRAARTIIKYLLGENSKNKLELNDKRLPPLVDYIFSLFYVWYSMNNLSSKPAYCPRCNTKLYVFTNFCPVCKSGIKTSYKEFRQCYKLKPEEDVIGRMGIGIARAILNMTINDYYVAFEGPKFRDIPLETDIIITEGKSDMQNILLIEAKVHPAIYIPVVVGKKLDMDIPFVRIESERLHVKELIRHFILSVGFDDFCEIWWKLWSEDKNLLKRAEGLLYGSRGPYDDTKNKPGIARTDDLKKALAQMIMYSTIRLECKKYEHKLFTGIFSNVYPKEKWGDLLKLIYTTEYVTNAAKFPLISAVICLTTNEFREEGVRHIFE